MENLEVRTTAHDGGGDGDCERSHYLLVRSEKHAARPKFKNSESAKRLRDSKVRDRHALDVIQFGTSSSVHRKVDIYFLVC